MNKKSIRDIDIKGKKVLMRVDFNVPLDKGLVITDDNRIRAALPSIEYILGENAKLILMSHLGRPKGEVNKKFSLAPAATRLSELIGKPVKILDDCIGDSVKEAVSAMSDGDVILLENLRFHKEETENDASFAKELASLGDIFVNDAFGTCHRSHASVYAITNYVKESCAGLLIEKETMMLNPILESPQHPFYVIIGGAKVESKIDVIENMGESADKILIGGKMALAFQGVTYIDENEREEARILMEKYPDKIILPSDYITEDEKEVDAVVIPENKNLFDLGSKTLSEWKDILDNAKTVIWNGPLGYFENPPFDAATNELANYLANSSAITIIGGGDSANAIRKLNLQDKMTHVSTGGGASLEFLEGKELPGLEVLGFYS